MVLAEQAPFGFAAARNTSLSHLTNAEEDLAMDQIRGQTPTGNEAAGETMIIDGDEQAFADAVEASDTIPVLVEFRADWSDDCNQLTPVLEKVVKATRGRLMLVRIDIDENEHLVSHLQEQGLSLEIVPTVVGVWHGGITDMFQGNVPEVDVERFVDELLQAAGGSTFFSDRPTNPEEPPEEREPSGSAELLSTLVQRVAETADVSEESVVAVPGPPQLLRATVQRANAIISNTRSELANIDGLIRAAGARREELRRGIVSIVDQVTVWVGAGPTESAFVPDCVNLEPFRNVLLAVELRSLYESRRQHSEILVSNRPKELLQLAQVFGWITGGAFVLFLLACMISDGVGPMKALYVLAIIIGLIVLGYCYHENEDHKNKIDDARRDVDRRTAAVRQQLESASATLRDEADAEKAQHLATLARQEKTLGDQYALKIEIAIPDFRHIWQSAELFGANLDDQQWSNWRPPLSTVPFLRVGEILPPASDVDQRLNPTNLLPSLPALVRFAPGRGLCFIGRGGIKSSMLASMQNVGLRLLAGIPPGKLRFVFIDPIGLGQNVALLLALGDHAEQLVGGRTWSEPAHIEQRLAETTQHMETVIQKYLRDEHKTIEDYNAQAGQVVEAYRVLIICDFPANFTDVAARRLVSIVQNGPRCGVYTVLIVDSERPMPYGVSLDPITSHMTCLIENNGGVIWSDPDFASWRLGLDEKPPAEITQRIVRSHGEGAEAGMRVSAPFSDLVTFAQLNQTNWNDPQSATSTDGLVAPLGPSGARKYQELAFGRGTAHHALVVGQTGSGKSNLLHILITTLALKYAPDELELYLIDFKQGVEFKLYADANLPHARVIAIQSEREFGLSVLRGLLAEMDRRGELFRSVGVSGLTDWRARAKQKLPRILLLVDEFRVFFTADDSISNEATMILDRLVSQGRAFGIHVMLASQTLAGGYALPRSITDQMAVRIVLQCTDADSRLALADDNPEARLLTRPGEAIYNDQRGLIEGNHRFQVADMGNDEARQSTLNRHLDTRLAVWKGELRRPIVFEGHQPARLEDCTPLLTAISSSAWPAPSRFVDVWLGEPIALRPPTAVRFLRQSGANLLAVMRDEGQAVALMQSALLALGAQLSPQVAGFHVVDMSSVDAPWAGVFEQLADAVPHRMRITGRRGLGETLEIIGRELEQRLNSNPPTESIFLVLVGLHRMRDLREDDGSGPFEQEGQFDLRRTFAKILREGPEVGIHCLMWATAIG